MNSLMSGSLLAAVLIVTPFIRAADKPASKIGEKVAPLKAASRGVLGPSEILTGKIVMVDPKSNLMVVKNSQGTTFDIVVTKMTRLQAADHRLHLKDLSADMNKAVSITFVPERSGDIARSIKVTG